MKRPNLLWIIIVFALLLVMVATVMRKQNEHEQRIRFIEEARADELHDYRVNVTSNITYGPLTPEQVIFLSVPKELYEVARCESKFIIDAKNPRSTASGVFQFIDSTAESTYKALYGSPLDFSRKNDLYLQIEMAMYLYENDGLSHWEYPCGTLNSTVV